MMSAAALRRRALLKALGMGEDEVSFPLQKLNPEERRIADGMLRRAGLRE